MSKIELDSTVKSINKKYGIGVIQNGSNLMAEVPEILSVAPALDFILSGGILMGSYVTCSGRPKMGKTTTILSILANAQKEGRKTFYMDVEHRLKKMNLSGIKGLDVEKLHIIRSSEDKILVAEDYLTIGEEIIKDNAGCILVVDSLAALITSGTLSKDVSGSLRSDTPKLLGNWFQRISPLISLRKSCVFGINHLINNTSGYGPTWVESGGNKSAYNADISIRIKGIEYWKVGETIIGQKVTWTCIVSAMGAPCGECVSYLRYGVGLDRVMELIEQGKELGAIGVSGSWLTLDFLGSEEKVQGAEKLYQVLESNPEYIIKLQTYLSELLYGKK